MDLKIIEAEYTVGFREEESKILGDHLSHRHNVELVGMKRVGISNFLRFFLNNTEITKTYLSQPKHLFIQVDLNDLVERELFPFWTLTLKRIVDAVNASEIPQEVKSEIESLFLSGIQSQDLFLLIDAIRQSFLRITEAGYIPTLFLLRFDRIKDVVNPAFFDNLQGLRDATNRSLAYVFTSYRRLDVLAPTVFPKAAMAGFTHVVYIKPANEKDSGRIYETLRFRYSLDLDKEVKEALLQLVSGNVQYLQLALIILHEKKGQHVSRAQLLEFLQKDERITMQSEELWESLTGVEKEVLLSILEKKITSEDANAKAPYLFQSGFVYEEKKTLHVLNPLFTQYLREKGKEAKNNSDIHFTKKEHSLFTLLESRTNEIVTREEIIEAVWPEAKVFGVSDWAIDRLVARVRSKMRTQKNESEITTIRTRGYKLQEM